jgi:nucleotidyltransferase/DNA polymerase involved in DNA repair
MLPGIGRRTAKVLHGLQIHTVGQFKAMPERVLVELFGPSISAVHQAVQSVATANRATQQNIVQPNLQSLRFGQRLRLATQLLML